LFSVTLEISFRTARHSERTRSLPIHPPWSQCVYKRIRAQFPDCCRITGNPDRTRAYRTTIPLRFIHLDVESALRRLKQFALSVNLTGCRSSLLGANWAAGSVLIERHCPGILKIELGCFTSSGRRARQRKGHCEELWYWVSFAETDPVPERKSHIDKPGEQTLLSPEAQIQSRSDRAGIRAQNEDSVGK